MYYNILRITQSEGAEMASKFDFSVFKQPRPVLIKKMILAFLGDVLIGLGIGLHSCAGLGNDPISVFSDGLHKFFNISMGLAVNITAYTLLVVVLAFGRKYINIGTLINVLPLGSFVNLGVGMYSAIGAHAGGLILRGVIVIVACVFLYFGTALFITVDIGQDTWTGFAMLLRDKTGVEYRLIRMVLDVSSFVIGFLLGGTVGAATILSAILGGPTIQMFCQLIKKLVKIENDAA